MFLAIFQTEKAKNRFHAAIILRRQNGGRSAAGHMTNKMAAPTIRGWDLSIARPLSKKAGLDKNTLKNYRPVSNCSFLDKFIEKAASKQLNEYFSEHFHCSVNFSVLIEEVIVRRLHC